MKIEFAPIGIIHQKAAVQVGDKPFRPIRIQIHHGPDINPAYKGLIAISSQNNNVNVLASPPVRNGFRQFQNEFMG